MCILCLSERLKKKDEHEHGHVYVSLRECFVSGINEYSWPGGGGWGRDNKLSVSQLTATTPTPEWVCI